MRGHSWLWWLVAACVVLFVLANPQRAGGLIVTGLDGVVTFFTTIIDGISTQVGVIWLVFDGYDIVVYCHGGGFGGTLDDLEQFMLP